LHVDRIHLLYDGDGKSISMLNNAIHNCISWAYPTTIMM